MTRDASTAHDHQNIADADQSTLDDSYGDHVSTRPPQSSVSAGRTSYADRTTWREWLAHRRHRDLGLGDEAGAALQEPADPNLDLTIVVPFYNTGRQQLAATLGSIVTKLEQADVLFEVIAVDDGSADDSYRAVADLGDDRVRLHRLDSNQGKGGALLNGFARARAGWIGFIDADGDIDPRFLGDYLATAVASDSDMVVADKTHSESSNDVAAGRAATSQVMHLVNGRLLHLTLTDTQTGAKIFRRDFLAEAVPLARERGFALDVELFVLARLLRYRRVLGMPVAIDRSGGSTVSTRAVLKTGSRVMRIWGREKLGFYQVNARRWEEEAAAEMAAAGIDTNTVAGAAAMEAAVEDNQANDRRSGRDRRRNAVPGVARDRRSLRERRTEPRE